MLADHSASPENSLTETLAAVAMGIEPVLGVVYFDALEETEEGCALLHKVDISW